MAAPRRTQIGQQYDALERAEASTAGPRRRAAELSLATRAAMWRRSSKGSPGASAGAATKFARGAPWMIAARCATARPTPRAAPRPRPPRLFAGAGTKAGGAC